MWEVQWQDFKGFREVLPDKTPDVVRESYQTKELAEARKVMLQRQGMTACVNPLRIRKKNRRSRLMGDDDEKFNANWKLH